MQHAIGNNEATITLSYFTYSLFHEHFDYAETIPGMQIHTNLLSEGLSDTADTVDSTVVYNNLELMPEQLKFLVFQHLLTIPTPAACLW